jgi:hypothetical protein|tara:strand:- start:232 stop:423 length:192 start_codon:yes stop_codon:yes gene_type:complete
MEKEKYKIGDTVKFKFIGVPGTGIIESISNNQVGTSKHNLRFDINDGKFSYPVGLENIIKKVK